MSSGGTRLKTNLRERAVSPDLGRAQDFAAADRSELLRYLLDPGATLEAGSAGVESTPGTLGTPLRALVFSGLLPRPQLGTDDMLVTAGVLLASSPFSSPSADDSPYKLAVDPGVQTLGQLVFTPNAGPERLDVLECRVIDELVASETRDVFDLALSTFAGALVEKVRRVRLEYRIRVGSSGAGFPGLAAGWLPLLVASSGAGATVWDDCVLWDVRPLASDLAETGGVDRAELKVIDRARVASTPSPFSVPATNLFVRGRVEARHRRFRAAGVLDDDGGDAGSVDVLATANHDATATPFVADRPWYLWALFPHGLPRWCRYRPSTGLPGPFRGIAVVSRTGPSSALGDPATTLRPPAGLGFLAGSAASTAALVVAGLVGDAANKVWGVEVDGACTRHLTYAAANAGTLVAPTASGAAFARWDFVDNTHFPACVRAVWLELSADFSGMTAGGIYQRQIVAQDVTNAFAFWQKDENVITGTAAAGAPSFSDKFQERVPAEYFEGGLSTRRVFWNHAISAIAGPGAAANVRAKVVGWEIG